MVKINFIANIFGSTGYARHARSLVNALYEENPEINLDTLTPQGWELMITDAEKNMITNPHYDDGITIMIGTPENWMTGMILPSKAFVGFAVWEGDRVPIHWLPHLVKADSVLVPSTHVKEAILNTDTNSAAKIRLADLITVIPHGVDINLFTPQEKKEGPFTFTACKGWAKGAYDRGGIQFLLRAYCEEFRPEEDVQLKIKLNTVYSPPGWDLSKELEKLNVPKEHAALLISTTDVVYEELPAFYAGDCFVSPTMAEGFNIPCIEAMSCAIPVITTDFGGQTDFVTEENGWLVKSTPWEVQTELSYEGINWAMPDKEDLRKKLRYAFENRLECQGKGLLARKTAEKYTWRASAEKLLTLLGQL